MAGSLGGACRLNCCFRNYISSCGRKQPLCARYTRSMATRWLTDSEQAAWRTLISTTTGVLATLDNELQSAHGLSLGEYEVLARLSEAPGHSLRMTDLAGSLH